MNEIDDVDILLAEDNARDAELVLRAMRKAPFPCRVFWVRDGVETLAFLRCQTPFAERDRSQRPKLILLDLKMPRIDGLGVLKALRSDPVSERIPIVMMTSSGLERDVAESYATGVNSFVVKPVEPDRLTETIVDICRYWLRLNRVPSP